MGLDITSRTCLTRQYCQTKAGTCFELMLLEAGKGAAEQTLAGIVLRIAGMGMALDERHTLASPVI